VNASGQGSPPQSISMADDVVGDRMPLRPISGITVDQAGVISFQMCDRDKIVRVDVKHEVLVGRPQVSSKTVIAGFNTNRDQIERLASAKYDSSDFATYANGAVVSIVAQDFEAVASGASAGPIHLKEAAGNIKALAANASPFIRKLSLR
jgi:hypothetical protein